MKPSPTLYARLRFSTKDVGKGFYRGNRTGSMGAHTPRGGYLIDYRKVRSFTVPDLKDFGLTPYVTREIGEKETKESRDYWWEISNPHLYKNQLSEDPDLKRRSRALDFIKEWRIENAREFDQVVNHQVEESLNGDTGVFARSQNGEHIDAIERVKEAEQNR